MYSIDFISNVLNIYEPFLMIDEIIEVNPGNFSKSKKNINNTEWFFKCHLPEQGVMPLTLITEGMLQNTAFCVSMTQENSGKISFIKRIDNLEINKKVTFELKELYFFTELISYKRGIYVFYSTCTSNNQIICSAYFQFVSPHLLPQIKIKNE